MLVSNSGHIVSTASIAGFIGAPCLADYSTSKFAAIGFLEALGNELELLGKNGINTTIVCPAFVRTQMVDTLGQVVQSQSYTRHRLSDSVPLLEPEFVAERVVQAVLTNQKLLIIPKKPIFHYVIKGYVNVIDEKRPIIA